MMAGGRRSGGSFVPPRRPGSAHGCPRSHRRLRRHRGSRRSGSGLPDRGAAGLYHRGLARQGRRREPGEGARRPDGHRAGPAAEAHHRQPGPGRPSKGRQPLRPSHCLRCPDRHGGSAPGGDGWLRDPGGSGARRLAGPGRRCAAGGAGGGPCRARSDLPGGAGRRGGLGRRRGRSRARWPAGIDQPLQGRADPGETPARRRAPTPARAWTWPTSRARKAPAGRWRWPPPAPTTC